MKVTTKECLGCNEPWVYIRLTRREAAILVEETSHLVGKILPKMVAALKCFKEPA